MRAVEAGDTAPGGGTIKIEPAIEVGNIFKLGTRYSEPLGAKYLDESGTERPIVMGSYGIGPARIVAAAVEQRADEKGIVWPPALAPWQVELVGLGSEGDETTQAADRLYEELAGAGLEVLFDDRDAGPGEKLTDAELLGCPLRVVVGKRALAEGQVEAQERATGADHRLELADGRGRRAGAARAGRVAVPGEPSTKRPRLSPPPPGRARPLGPAAAADAGRRAAPPLDAAEPRRLPAPRVDPGLPLPRALLRRRAGRLGDAALPLHHPGRLPRRVPRPGDRPVLADGRAPRPGRRPPERPRRHRRLLALRASSRTGRWSLLAVREVATLVLARMALRRGIDLEISWVGRVVHPFHLHRPLLVARDRQLGHGRRVPDRPRPRDRRDARSTSRTPAGECAICSRCRPKTRQAQLDVLRTAV